MSSHKHKEHLASIKKAIDKTKMNPGGIYDKAARLLIELTCIHAFESGNKRTAFLSTKKFALKNGGKFNIPDTINNVKVMIGIRENYYSQNEIKEVASEMGFTVGNFARRPIEGLVSYHSR